MKMTLEQTKLVGLTMELDLKAREYKKLCDTLDKLKAIGIDPNAPQLVKLSAKFKKNLEEIREIKRQLAELNEEE